MLVPQKSELTLLCERFQQQFGHVTSDGSANMLMLNDVAEALGVPRRRLYDVINVFESIEVCAAAAGVWLHLCFGLFVFSTVCVSQFKCCWLGGLLVLLRVLGLICALSLLQLAGGFLPACSLYAKLDARKPPPPWPELTLLPPILSSPSCSSFPPPAGDAARGQADV
jgi:hypothetical protein